MTKPTTQDMRTQIAEMELAEGAGVGFQTFLSLKNLLAAGVEQEDLQNLLRLVQVSGVPIDRLVNTLQEIGGATPLAQAVRNEIHALEAQKVALTGEVQRAQATLRDLNTRAGEAKELLEETVSQVQGLQEDGEEINRTYRLLGLTLKQTIEPILAGNQVARVEHLERDVLRALAGNIITMAVELFDDEVFHTPPDGDNLVAVNIRLSKIPSLLAPAAAYKAQRQLIARQKAEGERLLQEAMAARFAPVDEGSDTATLRCDARAQRIEGAADQQDGKMPEDY